MSGGIFRLLTKVKRLQRLASESLAEQYESAPATEPETPPSQPPPSPGSIEERFWAFWRRANPRFFEPRHFRVYVQQVLGAIGGDKRLVFASPPQHGKTETTLALLVFLTLEFPGLRWAYVTYNQKRANAVARKVRRLFAGAGVAVGGTLAQMYIAGGGQILFTSVDGGITGEPIDGACFIDDPYKNRKEADSQARRSVVEETYREAIEVRVHPGASLFVLATRWHPQDLSGTLIEEGWDYINLRAIAEAANDNDVDSEGRVKSDPNGRKVGEALFPDKWPAEALAKKRSKVLEFTWVALYQGRPRPKGGKVFHEPTYYTALPKNYRGAYGLDLAFTAKTSADWSACWEMWRDMDSPADAPVMYVIRVDRKQVEAPEFGLLLKARHVARRTWPMLWRASGTERAAAQFLRRLGVPVAVRPPPGDKLVSNQDFAAAWNDGRIRMPDPSQYENGTRQLEELEEWLYPVLDEAANFTGTGNERDDSIDAGGNAHAALMATGTDDGQGVIVVDRDDD